MKKIINTFKYGPGKTKLILIFTILAGVATLALFVVAFIISEMLLFFGGIIGAFLTITLGQTFAIAQSDIPTARVVNNSAIGTVLNNVEHTPKKVGEKKEKYKKTSNELNNKKDLKHSLDEREQNNTDADSEGHGENLKAISNTDQVTDNQSTQAGNNTHNDTEIAENEPVEAATNIHNDAEIAENEPVEVATNIHNDAEIAESEPVEAAPNIHNDTVISENESAKNDINTENKKHKEKKVKQKKEKKAKKVKENSIESKEISSDDEIEKDVFDNYDKKQIKKTMHKYRVKRDHRMVMIDHCQKLNIYQSPAYVWIDDKEFNILVIDKEPRHMTIPIYSIGEITYLKKYPGNEEKEYTAFKGNSVIANLFKPYLPDYIYNSNVDDIKGYKNLYGIGPGIYFTNKSASNLFDLLSVNFYVDDKVTKSNKANIFFKEVYKCNIFLRDSVIDANGYADKVSKILDDMAHSTISYNEFKETLNLLVRNKLITQEFATHYNEVRDKISR